jgi:hypothetical protein
VTTKNRGIAFPQELHDDAEFVARVRGVSVNALVIQALTEEIKRAKADPGFLAAAKEALARDQEILNRMTGE